MQVGAITPVFTANYNTKLQKNSNVAFTGITSQMNKRTHIDGQRDISKIVEKHKDRSLVVGQLPRFIMDRLPKENREAAIKEIYDVFAQVTERLRNYDQTKVQSIAELMHRRDDKSVKMLEDVLTKYNIISKWDDFDLEYLGKGGKGAVYKLVGLRDLTSPDEDELVIKVFHQVKGDDWQLFKSHGCYAEINSAAYWMNNVGYDTNRGKFFFADLKSGFIVNKYIDEDVRIPHRIVDVYRLGLKVTDEDAAKKHNVCKGYSYDWGGLRVVNRIKNGDKYARKMSEIIKNTDEKYRELEWWKHFSNTHKANKESINAGLAMSIKHLKDKTKYIDTCLELNQVKVNRALSYVLKYLPYETAVKYFEKLFNTKDALTQVILYNEVPLLAMKHRDKEIKDDLQTVKSEIISSRVAKYYEIANKYVLPDAVEHAGSFIHLVPKSKFREYYSKLVKIDRYDLRDRLLYKFEFVDPADRYFVLTKIAEAVKTENLKNKLLEKAKCLTEQQLENIKNILRLRNFKV